MESFPTLPKWVELEHQVQQILTEQEIHGWRFDQNAAWELTSALTKSYERLKSHYAGNTLTSQEQNSLRNEITARKDMLRVHPLLD